MSSPPPPPANAALDRLSSIVSGLSRMLWGKREYGFFTHLVVQTIGARMSRAVWELNVLMAAFRAGTLRTRRSPAPGLTRARKVPPAEPVEPDPMKLVTVPLPRAFGWLRKVMAEANAYVGTLETLLEDPELQALFAASPRAVRAVRPLCWMLGVKTPKPPRPVPPVPPAPVPPMRPTEPEGGAPPSPRPQPRRRRPPALRVRSAAKARCVRDFSTGQARPPSHVDIVST